MFTGSMLFMCNSTKMTDKKDQLPGGTYYQPDQQVMHETKVVPKENIISERDFAELDQQLDQTPTTSTTSVRGIVCFINKTPEYLENISKEEKCKMIMRAIQEAPGRKTA